MVSLVVSQPSTVDSLIGTALDGGATALKPAKKGFRGYGGVVQAPDGATWKIATSSKKDAGVSPYGTGSHRIFVGSDAGLSTDPEGFAGDGVGLRPVGPTPRPGAIM